MALIINKIPSSSEAYLKSQVNDFTKYFDYFVTITYSYMKNMYQDAYLTEDNLDLFPPEQAFVYYANEALKHKSICNTTYSKYLNKARKHFNIMSACVTILISNIEIETNKTIIVNSEFEMLGNKIKQNIKNLIKVGNKEAANELLVNYKQVNPSDTEINDLINEIDGI